MGKNYFNAEDPLHMIGVITLAYMALLIYKTVFGFIFRRIFKSPINIEKTYGGKWAVVTGSTDGIGKSYAFSLAKRGMHIVLISRTQSKLESVKEELKTKYPEVEVKTVAVDFVKDDLTAYRLKIARELEGLDVGVLVNNVGMSFAYPSTYLEAGTYMNDEYFDGILKCNVTGLNSMITLVLPLMKQKKKGIIINVASLSGMYTTPLLSVYSASKAYVDFLSRAMTVELEGSGITVQCILPSFVVTNMSKLKRASLFCPYPDNFVESALRRVGVESRTTGYWSHDLQVFVTNLFPEWLVTKAYFYVLKGTQKRWELKNLKKQK